MDEIILKLIKGQPIPKEDIWEELYETCSIVHASCNNECPVFRITGGCPDENPDNLIEDDYPGCDCFKNGKAMYDFLKSRLS